MLKVIKDETGIYVELPRERIQFVDKQSEILYDLALENDSLEQENQKYKEVIEKLKDAIKECWYMDSENIGEQVFLKKIELQNILKEVE